MKHVGVLLGLALGLSACGSSPAPLATGASPQSVEASGLFGGIFFKEAAYAPIGFEALASIRRDPEAHLGKKFVIAGVVGERAPEFGIGDYNVFLLDEEKRRSLTLFSGATIFSQKARKLAQDLRAGSHEVVTIYLEIVAKSGLEVKAVKYADGKLKTL